MFGFFKKQKSKPAVQIKKKAPAKKPIEQKSSSDPKPPTPNEVMQAVSDIQKQLDKLKLAVSSGTVKSVDPSDASASEIIDRTMDELKEKDGVVQKSGFEKVIEGVFDGQNMVGADGQVYDVPANYASKSKLVEGDILKLTINNMGSFVFKQIKPIERVRKVGTLDQDPQNLQFFAVEGNQKWKLLTASVTYFKGEPSDEIVFLIPADGESRWAAVENIVRE
ncbi:hypothetical protein HN958_01115 [Candidatus Falkowbacteria bacterium]|nr:hypothetical protein [Candidatus Falkowbacteria bacterium]